MHISAAIMAGINFRVMDMFRIEKKATQVITLIILSLERERHFTSVARSPTTLCGYKDTTQQVRNLISLTNAASLYCCFFFQW